MYSFFLVFRQHLIPIVLVSLIAIVVFLLFVDVTQSNNSVIAKERINPYVLSTQGKTIVKSANGTTVTLGAQQKKNIQADDEIETLQASTATIFWIDGSITRLGEKSRISVLELQNGQGDSTQVDFSISEGKSWSNIGRGLDPDSYFKQRYDNDQRVAAVRGTVFEVNVDKGYLRTESHAVTIRDEKGEYLATVSDGQSVTIEGDVNPIDSSALDPVWQLKNIENDTALAQQRLKDIREKLLSLGEKETWIAKIQSYLRELFGVHSMNLPITVNPSDTGISLSIDETKITSENTQDLLAIYEALSMLKGSEDTVKSKIELREAILKTLPEKDAMKYREIFSRATLFDLWDAIKNNLPNPSKDLRKYLETYTKESDNTEEVTQLQNSLNAKRIETFNARMKEWKDRGYDSLSDPEWFSKTFKIDSKSLMDIIEKTNATVDSAVKKIQNSVDGKIKDANTAVDANIQNINESLWN